MRISVDDVNYQAGLHEHRGVFHDLRRNCVDSLDNHIPCLDLRHVEDVVDEPVDHLSVQLIDLDDWAENSDSDRPGGYLAGGLPTRLP